MCSHFINITISCVLFVTKPMGFRQNRNFQDYYETVFHLHLDTFYGKYHSLKRRIPAKEARGSWSMYSYIILFCRDQVRICAWYAVCVLVIPISFYDSFTVQPSSTRLSIRPIDWDIYRILIVSGCLLLTWCFIGHNKTDKNVVLSLNLEHFLSSVRIQQGRTGLAKIGVCFTAENNGVKWLLWEIPRKETFTKPISRWPMKLAILRYSFRFQLNSGNYPFSIHSLYFINKTHSVVP